jgi:CheY-like chemotaxis protein
MENEEKPKIIYVEDYPTLRMAMGFLLGKDYSVIKSADGNDLKNKLENIVENGTRDIKAILTDNNMPGHTGSELIAEYANRENMPPMILLYGGISEIGEKALKNGAYAYFIKPADSFELNEKISEAIERYSK